jgi:hypothetical protein
MQSTNHEIAAVAYQEGGTCALPHGLAHNSKQELKHYAANP